MVEVNAVAAASQTILAYAGERQQPLTLIGPSKGRWLSTHRCLLSPLNLVSAYQVYLVKTREI